VTSVGGTKCRNLAACGTVFSFSTTGANEQVLHSFGKPFDGASPWAALIAVNGTLYGMTICGGAYMSAQCTTGGTVFSMSLTGADERVLHSFGNGLDGSNPYASLIDIKGTLYGLASAGGQHGGGALFSLN
jgi:uncharacterized repeat protein (TIGR03803 family)